MVVLILYIVTLQNMCLSWQNLSLFESFALPVLMYGIDGLFLGSIQTRKLNVCWNFIYGHIFNFHRWESIKVLQLMCQRFGLTLFLDKISFIIGYTDVIVTYCSCSIVHRYQNAVKCYNLFNKYDACVGDVCTDVIFCKFTDLCRLNCVC